MTALFNRLVVVLVEARNPLNIGAAARAMSNFGFRHLRLVNPYHVAFREAKSAVGASALLKNAREYEDVIQAVADCRLVVGTTGGRKRRVDHQLYSLKDGTPQIYKNVKTGKVAVLFGSEKHGLSNQDLSHCHWLMRIPTREEHPSMNLGQAVAVSLYELKRGERSSSRQQILEKARGEELNRLITILIEALYVSGYLKAMNAAAEDKVRRLVHRLDFPAQDAHLWLGMLRQMLWKMRSRAD
ncbi:MAG: RNA methyltransferase [Acidobacteria bacterium]|nr:RNA methyltransferase [Acidobacteriota bacterium]